MSPKGPRKNSKQSKPSFPRLGFRVYFQKPHLRDRVYILLTSELFQLEPGDRYPLTEKGIARELDAPFSAVREALGRLEDDGIIDRRQGKGIIVVNPDGIKIDNDTIEHYYDLRKLIESRNAAIAASAGDEELLEDLSEIMLAMRGAAGEIASGDEAFFKNDALIRQLVGFDVRFHSLIAAAVGDDFTHELLEMLLAILLPHRRLSIDEPQRLASTLAEHEAILENIKKGDPIGAARAMENHIDQVCRVRRKERGKQKTR